MTEKRRRAQQDAPSNVTAAEDTTQPPQDPAGADHGLHWMALPISGGRR